VSFKHFFYSYFADEEVTKKPVFSRENFNFNHLSPSSAKNDAKCQAVAVLQEYFDHHVTTIMSDTWAQCYKTVIVRELWIFILS
jgi:hypothetical protein